MSRFTTLAERKFIETLAKAGKTSRFIADKLGMSIWTVRKWRQQLKKKTVESKMGRPKKGALSTYSKKIKKAIRHLREKNEGWGALSILDELVEKKGYKYSELPSESSVERYLSELGMITQIYERHGSIPRPKYKRVKHAHDLWEVDAQGANKVDGLGYHAMINMKDSYSLKYCMSFPVTVRHQRHQPSTIHYL